LAVAIAMLAVAVTSPLLGAIADFSGAKKRLLFVYTAVSITFTAGLFFAMPGRVWVGMGFFILAELGYRGAQVFYNALLTEIAEPEEMGRVSGYGWAIGTAGGVLCLLLILPLIVFFGDAFADPTFVVRLSLVITAVFWTISAAPLFFWLSERSRTETLPPGESYLSVALKQLRKTVRAAGRFKEFLKFIVAFLVYNDGIIMALDFAAIIGAVLFGLDQENLIVFVILVQVTNVVGAYVFGLLVDRIGGKRSLALSLLLMIGVVIWLYSTRRRAAFTSSVGWRGLPWPGRNRSAGRWWPCSARRIRAPSFTAFSPWPGARRPSSGRRCTAGSPPRWRCGTRLRAAVLWHLRRWASASRCSLLGRLS
jgi:UMF1 family MFS transporter